MRVDWIRSRTAGLVYAAAVVLLLMSVMAVSETRRHGEAVLNPSAEEHLSDWRVGCDDGSLALSRVEIDDGPGGVSTAVDLRHPGGMRDWCMARAGLRDPETFFQEGRTYRLRAYVRDLGASGQSAGILLANSNFADRPTQESRYGSFSDDSWHLLQRTFVATHPAGPDTVVYIDLPTQGSLHWQITLVSVQEVQLPRPPVLGGDPNPVLHMTFDGPEGSRPDAGLWTYEVGGHGWGNDEVQSYTNRTSNAALDGQGSLVLTAREEVVTGPDAIKRNHSSARLSTAGKFAIPPGSYVEATIRAPADEGVRPAFWLIGADFEEVGWPACGELDVMEGTRRSGSMVRQTIHFPRANDLQTDAPYGEDASGGYTTLDTPRDGDFHRYGVYFDGDVVQFYVDRKPTLGLTRVQAEERGRTWPFGQPQNAVLNVALGPDLRVPDFPVSMVVADIAIWQGGVPLGLGAQTD